MVIEANKKGTCPHCKTPNRFEEVTERVGSGRRTFGDAELISTNLNRIKQLKSCRCTACGEIILFLDDQMIYPLGSSRKPCPKEVPIEIAEDYKEACLVEHLSSKAAAALARRCLQNMLHNQEIKKRNLDEEIEEAMKNLPTYLSQAIDSIRNIGNFAAHPMKSTQTGSIVAVEEGEVEWILDVIEQLFDFYYVQPTITQSKKDALNLKLKEAGKPEMK